MADLSDAMSSITNGITGITTDVKEYLGTSTSAAIGGAVVGSAVTGAVALGIAAAKSKSSKSRTKSKRRITHTKRGWKQDRKRFNKRQKWEVAYRKRKARKGHKKGVRYTKNGQPYIILKSGKARFIKGRRRK